MDRTQLMEYIEATLFTAGDPVSLTELELGLELTRMEVMNALAMLAADYEHSGRGLMLRWIEERVQLVTKPHCAQTIRRILSPAKKRSLSQAALETLSIVAYKQPITKGEIEQIRGVRCDYALEILRKLEMIDEVGRRDSLGRPLLFGTTLEFLKAFGLSGLDQLPELEALVLPEMEEENNAIAE